MGEPELVPDGTEKDRSASDIAWITSKLDVITERPQKLEVLDQVVVQVAIFDWSLEYCYDLGTQDGERYAESADGLNLKRHGWRRRQARADHDAVIDLQWRTMRDNLFLRHTWKDKL